MQFLQSLKALGFLAHIIMTREEANFYGQVEYVSNLLNSLDECYVSMRDELGEEAAERGYNDIIQKQIEYYTGMRSQGYINDSIYRNILNLIKKVSVQHEDRYGNKQTQPTCEESQSIVCGGIASGISSYRSGDLLIPGNLEELPTLEAARTGFVAPATIDLRDYCIRTRDQGYRPWCAAFAATSFQSNVYWRKKDIPETFDPAPVYDWAKKNDGSPKSNGTTLNAALQALIEDGSFDKSICNVKVLRDINQIKYAIHKFGCCLIGLDVTTEWNTCNKNKSTIIGQGKYDRMGGHAVLSCGYNRDGLIIQNSWGEYWGSYGFALITWDELEREFLYGAVIDNCLYDTRMN